jgi:NAD(P)-dependent dehydrogenase (short-subunit alcohol dehydrogenase family)
VSRRVLVTGAASGLGAALVAQFAARGDQVLATDLAGAHEAPAEGAYLRLDVCADDDWLAARRWVETRWGGLDVLVNNAGIAAGGRIDVSGIDHWRRSLDVNLLGVVRGCQTFAPVMKRQSSGHIVNIASLAGLVHPPGFAAYNAGKAAVVALSETLQHELAPWGITTTVVCPSFFRTNLGASMHGVDPVAETMARWLIERSTLEATDVAREVMAGIDARTPLVLPDDPARAAYRTKQQAREAYDRDQRRMADRLYAAERPEGSST